MPGWQNHVHAPFFALQVGGQRRRKRKGSSASKLRSAAKTRARRLLTSTSRSSSRSSKPARLIKGSLAAKRFMAALRRKRGKKRK